MFGFDIPTFEMVFFHFSNLIITLLESTFERLFLTLSTSNFAILKTKLDTLQVM